MMTPPLVEFRVLRQTAWSESVHTAMDSGADWYAIITCSLHQSDDCLLPLSACRYMWPARAIQSNSSPPPLTRRMNIDMYCLMMPANTNYLFIILARHQTEYYMIGIDKLIAVARIR